MDVPAIGNQLKPRAVQSFPATGVLDSLESARAAERALADALPEKVWTADSQGTIDFLNARWLEAMGLPTDAPTAEAFRRGVHPEDLSRVLDLWERGVEGRVAFEFQFRLFHANVATHRWHLGRAAPVLGPDSTPQKWVGLATDIDSEKRLADERAHLEKTREHFLAILGQDLRTPLTAITVGARSLSRAKDLPEVHLKTAQKMGASASRIGRLISDVLDFTRIRLGSGVPIERQVVDLREIVGPVIQEFEITRPGRELRLSIEGDLRGHWDPERISQVAMHLIGNALQHGVPAEAPVQISLFQRGDSAGLSVSNGSRTFPAEELPGLFEPFRQGGTVAAGSDPSSFGLGLYIASNIVEAHGGTLEVTSAADVTCFTVLLPKNLAPAVAGPDGDVAG